MRNFFIALICFVQVVTMSSVYAGGVMNATFPQQLVEDISFVATKASSYATQISTAALKYDALIGRPLATMMLTIAQQEMATNMLNYVNGGFDGAPLIINNPEKYISQQGHVAAKSLLDSIPVDSTYGESVFGSLASQYQDISEEDAIAAMSQSEIPSIIQEDICDDAHLEELVIDEATKEDGTVDQELLKTKKQELYDYACTTDASDPEQAAKIKDLSEQNPSLCGWECYLKTTEGDNPYVRGQNIKNLVDKSVQDEEYIADSEVYRGAAPVSQTKCIKYADTKVLGAEKVCLEKVTLSPGDTVASTLERSANSAIDRLTNLTESGLTGLITTMAMQKLSKGLNTAFLSSSAGGSGSVTVTNNGNTVSTSKSFVQDLSGDKDTKDSVTAPMIQQLNYYSKELDSVRTADQSYLVDINAYQSRVESGRACYDSLIENNTVTSDNPQVTAAYDFYNNRQAKIDAIKNPLLAELRKITEAKTLVADTLAKINTSNSTQEISSLFNTYISTINTKNYPTSQTAAEREGEHRKNKAEGDADKEIDTYQATCNQLGGSGNGGFVGP